MGEEAAILDGHHRLLHVRADARDGDGVAILHALHGGEQVVLGVVDEGVVGRVGPDAVELLHHLRRVQLEAHHHPQHQRHRTAQNGDQRHPGPVPRRAVATAPHVAIHGRLRPFSTATSVYTASFRRLARPGGMCEAITSTLALALRPATRYDGMQPADRFVPHALG